MVEARNGGRSEPGALVDLGMRPNAEGERIEPEEIHIGFR